MLAQLCDGLLELGDAFTFLCDHGLGCIVHEIVVRELPLRLLELGAGLLQFLRAAPQEVQRAGVLLGTAGGLDGDLGEAELQSSKIWFGELQELKFRDFEGSKNGPETSFLDS